MVSIQLIRKLSGAAGALHLEVQFTLNKGDLITLYGASGSGKTSVLRMIAGLLSPDGGVVTVNGETWYHREQRISLKPQQRNVGIVFQDYALFPNMTVRENIAYGLRGSDTSSLVDELIQMMELGDLGRKRPHLLSGGQKQRVALARAIVRKPQLLLLDEPLAALDTEMRFRMQDYIQIAHREFNLTTILVSHDILEVAKLSPMVYVLDEGKIIRSGKPNEVLPLDRLREMVNGL